MMIVDDYLRLRWPYFFKQTSDVPTVSAGFVAEVNAKGVLPIVECLLSDNGTDFTKQSS